MRPSSLVLGLVSMAVLAAFLCYRGTFYQTGARYYDVCWDKLHSGDKGPTSSQQAAEWAICDDTAYRAVYGAGFVFADSEPKQVMTPALQALANACPTGDPSLAVELIQDSGGPRLVDHFVPSHLIIRRVFREQWPLCTRVAAANGFPHLVKHGGEWVWERSCNPCQAEQESTAASDGAAKTDNPASHSRLEAPPAPATSEASHVFTGAEISAAFAKQPQTNSSVPLKKPMDTAASDSQ